MTIVRWVRLTGRSGWTLRGADSAPKRISGTSMQPGKHRNLTLYRRPLPCPPALAFSSDEGKQLFAEALSDGTMEGFFPLVEQFTTQDEPAYCGLASLAMVLNTLAIDPKRLWKGRWRWFHEELLDCCKSLAEVAAEGIDLDQAACLARCNGAEVDLLRPSDNSLAELRGVVEQCCRSHKEHIVASYSRKAFAQTGDGHFSPIGGYHRAKDCVLILDVARFKYPPHWVPLPLLHAAMGHKDPSTGRARGLLRLRPPEAPASALLSLNVKARQWRVAAEFLAALPKKLAHAASEAEIVEVLAAYPSALMDLIDERTTADPCCGLENPTCMLPQAAELVLAELRSAPLHELLADRLEACSPARDATATPVDRLCIAAFVAARGTALPARGKRLLAAGSGCDILAAEIDFLARQLRELLAMEETAGLQHST